ncbi:oligosaccharide flippase family protein [Pseudomonas protegens]|uniref:oligosaccharide flippase family protein n=1 Tax=Pseudomonas protegens TaxID=380021 RepID=UPI002779016A|nr:oligosaccharide flippase family protein [Pseudomonas protegens]MDP9527379.1 oligosaccharide flippase family protein [Pseudomonas protegens]
MSSLFRNMGVLFFAQVFTYIIPILEIPILARSLGVQEYGKIVLIQSIALLSSLIVEYGFSLSGSRQVAIFRDDVSSLVKIYGSVLSAKLLISSALCVFGFLLFFLFEGEAYDGKLLIYGGLYFLAFGFSPFWFFQGLEKITLVVSSEVILRFLSLLALYVFVHHSGDAALALGIMSGLALLNTIFGNFLCYRLLGRPLLSLSEGISQLRIGFHVFIYKSSNNIFLSAGPSLVGAVLGSVAVASYVPAEKLIRGFVAVVNPVLLGFYPYINRQFQSAKEHAKKVSWGVVVGMFFLGSAAAVTLYTVGDFLVATILGDDFIVAKDILKIFVWVIPFRLTNQALGLCILIPMGKDKVVSFWMMTFSVLSMLTAGMMSIWFGVSGVVFGFLLSELILCIVLLVVALIGGPEEPVRGWL